MQTTCSVGNGYRKYGPYKEVSEIYLGTAYLNITPDRHVETKELVNLKSDSKSRS